MNTKRILLVVVIALIVGAIYLLEQQKAEVSDNEDEETTTNPQSVSQNPELSPTDPLTSSQEHVQQIASNRPLPKPLTSEDQTRIEQKEDQYKHSAELTGLVGYLNGAEEGLQISDFRGKVVLVDFWTYTCINCIRTLPHLIEWDKKYRDQGLVIIGVHTPEFEFEKVAENVKQAIAKYGIEYRVVQDNNYKTWRAFENRYWPRKYLIDQDGFIRYDHIGEGAYDKTESMIKTLLAETGQQVSDTGNGLPDKTPTQRTTPELYIGYDFALPRGQNIGNAGGLRPSEVVNYITPDSLKEDTIYLSGQWESNADNAMTMESGASIVLDYTANAVNIVADAKMPTNLQVLIDGHGISQEKAGKDVVLVNGKSYVTIDKPLLYNVVAGDYEQHTLALIAENAGFSFNAFTFG